MSGGLALDIRAHFSYDLIKLFQREYERYVLEIMNGSKYVFPGKYVAVEEQSHGECDFVEEKTNLKFDAKLPFAPEQIHLLAKGKKREPDILEWISSLQSEVNEYSNALKRNDIVNMKLYAIMKRLIDTNKPDENIVFFFPFPVASEIQDSYYLQFATDILTSINDKLCEELKIDGRSLYAICPTYKRDSFAARNLSKYGTEYVECKGLGQYFEHELVSSQAVRNSDLWG